jgi:ParB family chromosome partitioning protein
MESRKGLRSLIPTGTLSEMEVTVQEIPVERISPNRYQPRRRTQDESLQELVESIRVHGILQPLVVRRRGTELELIAGERRLEAAKRAGLQRVPVIVREATDREMLELALVENLQREDINPMEAAEAYGRLVSEFHLRQEQIAERVGKSRSAIANSLRLLSLPPYIQESLREGRLEEGHGKILAGMEDKRQQRRLWRSILRGGLSVREAQRRATRMEDQEGAKLARSGQGRPELDPYLRDFEDRLRRKLSTYVRVQQVGLSGGLIEIKWAGREDLDRIFVALVGGDGIS